MVGWQFADGKKLRPQNFPFHCSFAHFSVPAGNLKPADRSPLTVISNSSMHAGTPALIVHVQEFG